jgi:hypothetical protein
VQSGSLDVSLEDGASGIALEGDAWQCVSVTPGARFTFGARVLVPGQLGSKGYAGLWYYASADCSGSLTATVTTPSASAATWQSVSAPATIPGSTHSMRVRLVTFKPIGQTSAEALFDDVVLTPL